MRLDNTPAIHLLCSSNKGKGATCHQFHMHVLVVLGHLWIEQIRDYYYFSKARTMENHDRGTTFQGNPTNESHGANAGGKTCL